MDDDQLRKLADSRPGYATYPDTRPGSPSWWQRHGQQPPARPAPTAQPWAGPDPLMAFGPPMTLAPADEFADEFAPTLAEQLQDPKVRAAYEAEAAEPVSFAEQLVERHGEPMREALVRARSRPDRRRWWHRWGWR